MGKTVKKYKTGSERVEFESCFCHQIARNILSFEIPFYQEGEMEVVLPAIPDV